MRASNRLNILGWLLLVTLPCASQEVAAPLGLEMGKSTCAEATRKLKVVSNDVSVWSDGPILRIPANSPSIDLESLVEALVICNAQDSVVFVGLTFPKGVTRLKSVHRPRNNSMRSTGTSSATSLSLAMATLSGRPQTRPSKWFQPT